MYTPSNDGYGLGMALDTVIRRGILTTSLVATRLVTAPFIEKLHTDPYVYTYYETVIDRSVDAVHASLQHLLRVSAASASGSGVDKMSGGEGVGVVDEDGGRVRMEEADGDDEERDAKHRRVDTEEGKEGEGEDVMKAEEVGEEENDTPISLAKAALSFAVTNCREVYVTLLTALFTTQLEYTPSDTSTESDALIAAHQLAAHSLLIRSTRSITRCNYDVNNTDLTILSDVVRATLTHITDVEAVTSILERLNTQRLPAVTSEVRVEFYNKSVQAWRKFG